MEKLDLHGVKHEDVERLVMRAINDNWGKGEPLKVITGHSPAMMGLVINVAWVYELPYAIGGFSGMEPIIIIGLDKT